MATKPHLAPVPSDEGWTSRTENSYDQGVISPNEARKFSGLPVLEHKTDAAGALPGHVHSIGREATDREVGLELVTADHEPQPGVRRESTYTPPPARTAREKAARDQGEALKHKTPPEWAPIIKPVR